MDISKEIITDSKEYEEIRRTFKKLKQKKPKNLDDQFHTLHDEVFQNIDCLDCANCCKTTSPIFRDVDIVRLSKHLKIKPGDFINMHLKLDKEGDYVLKKSPCLFLGSDNRCSVYEQRPLACKEYPHTNRRKMFQILDLTVKNTEVCPAVARIARELNKRS